MVKPIPGQSRPARPVRVRLPTPSSAVSRLPVRVLIALSQGLMMTKNLFVGNLPFQVSSEDLRGAFAEYGTVTHAHVVSERETGRSRGFGFVEMSEGGEEAIAQLN